MTNKTKTVIGIVGGVVVLGSVGAAIGGNDDKGTSSLSSSSSVVSSISQTSVISSNFSSNQVDPPQRETAIGKSDKDVDELTPSPTTPQTVHNDKTGNLRYAGFGNKDVDFSKYALSYYEKRFASDKEIHAIMNFTDQTTTRITCGNGMLFVTVFKYVKGEDYDVDLMFTGDIINDYIVYTDNGDIEEIANPEDLNSFTSEAISFISSVEPPPSSTAPENHFNDYSNPEQQNTTEYVLNTETFKIHFASCNDVKRIAEENYATTTNFDWAVSNGYTSCGHCHAH